MDVIHAYDISNKDDEGEEFEVKRNGRVTVLTVNAPELHVSSRWKSEILANLLVALEPLQDAITIITLDVATLMKFSVKFSRLQNLRVSLLYSRQLVSSLSGQRKRCFEI